MGFGHHSDLVADGDNAVAVEVSYRHSAHLLEFIERPSALIDNVIKVFNPQIRRELLVEQHRRGAAV
jgi:hypothetical protein